MDADSWAASTDWIALWKSLSRLEDADRRRRLIATELCRPLLTYLTHERFGQFVGLSAARGEGQPFEEEDWDNWEDATDDVADLAAESNTVIERAAAWVVAGLRNDDHKLGRTIESLPHFYGCLAAIQTGTLQPDESVAEGRGLQTDPSYIRGRDDTGPRVVAHMIRELGGNPFRPVAFDPSWRTEAVVGLARGMYEGRDFGPMPVLADALEDAGCADADVLAHCRGPGPHVRGCWVVDLVLGKN